MEGVVAGPDCPGVPQDGEGRDGGVAAEIHLLRRGEIADAEGVFPRFLHKSGLRVLQLPGQGAHQLLRREGLGSQQGHAGLVAGKMLGGEGVRDIQFHSQFPH